MANEQARHEPKGHPAPHEFHIQIDRTPFQVVQERLTGAELRQLPPTPIGSDRDLFEVVPGSSDRKVTDTDIVEMRQGLRFFTAPSQINPGAR